MSNVLSEQGMRTTETGAGPSDERPLSDAERKIVTRLLSDPFAFPQSFKTWLISFLEGSDLSLPLGSVLGLSTLLGVQSGGSAGIFGILPAGLLFPSATDVPPAGTVICNGAAYNRVGLYERLFKAIGTKWGAGNGTTTFNVPDFQNRAPYGIGPGYPLAATDGLASIARGPRHHHIGPSHTHGHSHVHDLGNHSHGMSHTHTYSAPAAGSGGVFNDGPFGYVSGASGSNTGGPSFASTSGPSNNSTGAPNFPDTSPGGNEDTSGGGPQDAPSYAVCAWVTNY